MADETVRCMRCNGRKKMYKVQGGYTHTNTGGVLLDCPMCLGNGKVKTLVRVLKDIEDAKEEKQKRKYTKRQENN
jgi:hypothetical protein